jgi:hypothetical protein
MNKNRLIILSITVVSFLVIRYFLLKPLFCHLTGYLSKTEPVTADILVVEGWLPHYAMEKVYNEFNTKRYKFLVTTGTRYTPTYYKISDNGYLIFYTHDILSGLNEKGWHSIEIKACSDMGGEDRAHFNLFINDSLAAGFHAETRKRRYTLNWYGSLKDIDSVLVQYDNDIYEPPLDRNLSVREICFDKRIKVPYLYNSEYDMLKLDGKLRFRNNLTTTAQFARSKLISMGIDSNRIKAVSAEKVRMNRTLTSALAFQKWLSSEEPDLNGINIITLGPHARRTWMTYNKIAGKKNKIGIIAIPEEMEEQITGRRKTIYTIREIMGIIYYWFILIPY